MSLAFNFRLSEISTKPMNDFHIFTPCYLWVNYFHIFFLTYQRQSILKRKVLWRKGDVHPTPPHYPTTRDRRHLLRERRKRYMRIQLCSTIKQFEKWHLLIYSTTFSWSNRWRLCYYAQYLLRFSIFGCRVLITFIFQSMCY